MSMTTTRTMTARRVSGRCDQCAVMMVNGVRVHEAGCPVAWREYAVECHECGRDFVPAFRTQRVCEDCAADAGC